MAFLSVKNKAALTIFFFSVLSPTSSSSSLPSFNSDCQIALPSLKDVESKCLYLSSNAPCGPVGYVDYLRWFYCFVGDHLFVGYALCFVWLLVLFYLLANTASQYFCPNLEALSVALKLPPALAGVTLLSLGNGAPDVFASVVSFATASGGVGYDVGLSSALGGAFFVSTVVAGAISLSTKDTAAVVVDRREFVRDLAFLIAVLLTLLAVLIIGKIGIAGSFLFLSIYAAYVIVVWMSHCCDRRDDNDLEAPLLGGGGTQLDAEIDATKDIPFLTSYPSKTWKWLLVLLEIPLSLPRRLTIPDASELRWSKPYAVASCALAPVLLTAIWNSTQRASSEAAYLAGALVGVLLAIAAMESTAAAYPPRKHLLPWLAGGFLMSVVWAYMTARELVALLVSLGFIVGVSPSILGLTVLAWGNSLSDLMANVAMATHGGPRGARIAVSGCYAGPLFNITIGLGVSLVMASWSAYPAHFEVPRDAATVETIGFSVAALMWAMAAVPRRGMQLDKVVGVGLVGVYACFLCFRALESFGFVNFNWLFL